jgi:excinuclease UvrABC nuclease subunit
MATDSEGKVLYVGRATRKEVWRRFAEHKERSGAEWMQLAVRIEVQEHTTHGSMRSLEQWLWEIHKPPHNKRAPGRGDTWYIDVLNTTFYAKDAFGRWHEQRN